MMYAKKIKMQAGCNNSNNTREIAEIYLEAAITRRFFPKATLHDYLKTNPNSIKVYISPYPYVVPATSSEGESTFDLNRMILHTTICLNCQECKGVP